MKNRIKSLQLPLLAWHILSIVWLAFLLLLGMMILFRALKHSGIARTFQFDDVPVLRQFDLNYHLMYWVTAGVGLAFVLIAASWYWFARRTAPRDVDTAGVRKLPTAGVAFLFLTIVILALGLISCRYSAGSEAAGYESQPPNVLDWLTVVAVGCAALLLPRTIQQMCGGCRETSPDDVGSVKGSVLSSIARFCLTYLISCGIVFYYAYLEHDKFWDTEKNGNYDYAQFFLDSEIPDANLVLYSTSVLFASVAAIGGCLVLAATRLTAGQRRNTSLQMSDNQVGRIALFIGIAWAAVMTIPWQIKISSEIQAERGWILPAVSIVFTAAAIVPVAFCAGLMMKRDFGSKGGWAQPHRSELSLLTFLLFPVYPVLRLLRLAGRPALHLALFAGSAAALYGLVWLVNKAPELYDFDDWRGMMKKSQFPFMNVLVALLVTYAVYLFLRRLLQGVVALFRRTQEGEWSGWSKWLVRTVQVVVVLAGVANLCLASWPFWGWKNVSNNVFARTVEYSSRHEFELLFLHWVFDADRDGYAAVLHGADPDDFDSNVQAGGIAPGVDVPVHIDKFRVADSQRAENFPNLLIFYLEGVVPRSIGAYGQRTMPNATRHMDSLAAEGTMFTQARCFYPSTWDSWMAVCTGRFLKVKEMDMSQPFHDRYSRHNNLYKALMLTGPDQKGIERWCHADNNPYYDVLVSYELRDNPKTSWRDQETYDTTVSRDEEERGIWRGDKRNERMLGFLDSLEPGERFFMCEHMADTHFPWRKTSDERAAELGFPDGLKKFERDANLASGLRTEKYSSYFQTITRMDAQIGQILDKLKEKDLYDETMIVVVSDHGCQWWEHEHMYYVSHLYEQAIRVPLIIKPAKSQAASLGLQAGNKSDAPVIQGDICQTVIELAGVEAVDTPADYPFTTRSLVPLMRGETSTGVISQYTDRDILLCTHYDTLGVISQSRYKLIFDRPTGTYLLFDLHEDEDPDERKNLADERPELLEELLEKLRQLFERHRSIIGGIIPSSRTD